MIDEAPQDDEELKALVLRIDTAAAGCTNALEVRSKLGVTDDEERTPMAAIEAAMFYIEKHKRGSPEADSFKPFSQSGGVSIPPPVNEMPDWALETWELCADQSTEPLVRARLHLLCFVVRKGNGRDHAKGAIEAYIEMADRYPDDSGVESTRLRVAIDATRFLARALDLARRTKQDDLATAVLSRLVTLTEHALTDPDAGAGIVLGFLDPLARDRTQVPELDDFAARARDRYQDNMWHTLSTIELQLARPGLGTEDRERLHRDAVQARIDEADRSTPMLALLHLRDAAEFALNHGLGALHEAAVVKMQAFAGTDIGMKSQRIPISLPADAVDGFIAQFTNAASWQDALLLMAAMMPPSGRVEQNRAAAAELPNIAPLASMFPTMRMGPDGLPRHASPGDDAEHHLVETEIRQLQILGTIYVNALIAIWEKWPDVSEAKLVTFFAQRSHVSEPLALAIARSWHRFMEGDYEGSAFTAIPRIERLARELLLSVGEAVFHVSRGSTPGQYAGLGAMFAILADNGMDESWTRFLDTFLTRQDGHNYRNELLHGSIDDVSAFPAGLALIAVLYLSVGVGPVVSSPTDTDQPSA